MKKSWIKRVVSATLVAAMVITGFAFVPVTANADTVVKKTAYLYSENNTVEMSCIEVPNMPVPYVAVDEYFNNVYTIPFTATNQGDGTYVIDNGKSTMVVNPADNTIHFDAPELFLYNNERYDTSSDADRVFERTTNVIYKGAHSALDLNLGDYNIDIIEEDGKVFMPLTTISDLAGVTYCNAAYANDKISFAYSMNPQVVNWQANFDPLERTPGEIQYTYNELCFVFDNIYGCPGNCEYADVIRANGLDGFLSNYNGDTRRVKELLQSASTVDFVFGVGTLGKMLDDAGHTNMFEALMNSAGDSEAVKQFLDLYDNHPEDERVALISKYINKVADEDATRKAIRNYEYLFDQYTPIFDVEEGSNRYRYFEYDDTGIFVFTNFDDNVVRLFKRALDTAKEHGMKNFILNVSNNGGGSSESLMYMMNAVTRLNYKEFYSNGTMTGNRVAEVLEFDMDQDGVFEGDKEDFNYDFNYAVMCSGRSFSCGNLFPCLCKEEGIPIIGETSGGGTDTLCCFRMPLGNLYNASAFKEVCYKSRENVEKGAAPDYDITKRNADGSVDYTDFYNFALLDKIVNNHYGVDPMYRLYNPNTGEHIYTSDLGEKDYLSAIGWNFEGIGWNAPVNSDTPVYRLFNSFTSEHYYTLYEFEKDILVGLGWDDEGIEWYSADNGMPIYRVFNPYEDGPAAHHFTANAGERDILVGLGYIDEGIGWYGL